MGGIFINYRREDAPGVAGRLYDYLAREFSRHDIFMDVDAMTPGMDFVRQLDASVSQCNVFLAVIGPHWIDTKDKSGRRRLDSRDDLVRIELASALKLDIPVIPVLVDGAAMPPEASLPDDLKPLARRHALELRHTRFSADAAAIMHVVAKWVPPNRRRWWLIGAAVGASAILAALAVFRPWPSTITGSAPEPPAIVVGKPAAPSPPVTVATPTPPAAEPDRTPPPPPIRTASIAGAWTGTYLYPDGSRSVNFTFSFDSVGCRGRSDEINTFGDKSAPRLFANLQCSTNTLAAGRTITITKTYDGTGGVSHPVIYTGIVSSDLRQISGQWEIDATTKGSFSMSR